MESLCKAFVIAVLTLSCQRYSVDADNLGGCKLFLENGDPINENSWTFTGDVPTPVKDTDAVGTVVYTYGCEGVSSITKGEATQPTLGVDYVDYKLSADRTQLIITVAPAFSTYEENESGVATLNTPVTFQCTSGVSEMKFRVPVALSNNNLPTFAADTETEMTVPMPFPSGWELRKIVVTDIDIGNNGITLTLDAVSQQSFELTPAKVTGKVYEFGLKPTKQLNLEVLTTVTVMAEDDSDGTQNTAVATLKFLPDVVLSTPASPRFTDALYIGAIPEGLSIGQEVPLESTITFSEGYDVDAVSVTIKDSHNAAIGLFEAEKVGTTAIRIKLKAALTDDVLSQAFLILELEAANPKAANTGRTIVHLTLPAIESTTTTETTATTTECPPPVTCPTTEAPTTCPECPSECTTPTSTTECPVTTCEPCTTCPTTTGTTASTTTTCPTCPTECPTETTTTECPVTCPTTTGTTDSTTTCPTCPTECPTETTTTECPVTCPTTTGTTDSTTTTCPTCPTECPTETTTTECPVTCEPCTTCPATTTTGTTCPTCPTECPTETTTTECPVTCPTTTGTTGSSTTCPTCPTECPTETTTTECPVTCPTTTTGTTDCPLDCSQCPTVGTTTCAAATTTTTAETSTTSGSTTTPVDEGSLTFEEDSYSEEIEASYTGYVLTVTAIDDRNRPLVYTIETTSSVITNRVSVDSSGKISVNKLPPGTFGFTVAATVQGTSLYANTKVTIRVQSVTLCGNVPQFEYALAVISMPENVAQEVIPGATGVVGTDCVYSLDSDDFFTVDPTSGALTSKLVDRESELFADMLTPQVSVHVHVQCNEHVPERRRSSTMAGRSWGARNSDLGCLELESVESSKQDMTVVAVIEDENDNAPIFTATSPLVVGYPSEELTAQLDPSSLVTVKATDKDTGKNAEIEYSLSVDTDATRFYVHPTSGTVYVLASDSTYSDQQLSVVATDQAGEGLPSVLPLVIQVRILSRSDVTEVLIEGALLEQVDDVVNAMSDKTAYTVHCLTASVMPSLVSATTPTPETRGRLETFFDKFRVTRDVSSKDESSQTVLKLVVYAVNGEQVVTSEEFKTSMDQFDSWTVQDIRQLQPNTDTSTNGGLLAAVISLGVIVGIMLIASGVVFFVYYVRPRMSRNEHLQDLIDSGYVDSSSSASSSAGTGTKDAEADGKANVTSWLHMTGDPKDTDSEVKNYSSDFEDLQKSPPDVKLNMEGSSHILTQFIMPDNPEMFNASVGAGTPTYPGDSDDEHAKTKDNEDVEAKKKARKKSVVTFNESVDCIEIEKM